MTYSNVNKIIDLIKRDDCQAFVSFIGNIENFNQTFMSFNELVMRKCGSQILHLCAQYNAHEICRFVCTNSVSDIVNCRDVEGKTPLHISCIFGSIGCSKIFLSNAAQVDALKRGDWTALMVSVSKSDLDLVRMLLEHGADLSLCNKDGWNAVHLATRTGTLSLLTLLEGHSRCNDLEHSWNVRTKNGRTLLHITAMHKLLEIAKYLLNDCSLTKYLDTNSKDVCGVTPFMDAARVNCIELCQLFLEHSNEKLNVNETDFSGRSALHMATQANAFDVTQYLVTTLKCDINLEDNWKQTPLFLAVREGHEQTTELLLKLGSKQLRDAKNRSPVDIALQYGHNKLVKYLTVI